MTEGRADTGGKCDQVSGGSVRTIGEKKILGLTGKPAAASERVQI